MPEAMDSLAIFITIICVILFFGLVLAAIIVVIGIIAHFLILIAIGAILTGLIGAFNAYYGPYEIFNEIRTIWLPLLVGGVVFSVLILIVSGMPEKPSEPTIGSTDTSEKHELITQGRSPKTGWSIHRALEKLFWKKTTPPPQ